MRLADMIFAGRGGKDDRLQAGAVTSLVDEI
jgi:hypothetical protein